MLNMVDQIIIITYQPVFNVQDKRSMSFTVSPRRPIVGSQHRYHLPRGEIDHQG